MIVVKIIGGLGNQLFQYALGRCVAYRYNTEFKLDISGFANYPLRTYSLRPFCIREDIVQPGDIGLLKYDAKDMSFLTWASRFFRNRRQTREYLSIIKEPHFYFWPKIFKLELSGNIYLDGYWQSEKYFKDIAHILRKEIVLKESIEDKFSNLIGRINNTNSVSIHIRRLDYVTNPTTYRTHGVCSLDYYMKAVKMLERVVSKPHFFIFSDDVRWARENIRLMYPTDFVSRNGIGAHEDMILLSKCKHHIIANSSFSWWGAWLNNNPEKIVIAPQKWFNDQSINTKDLIPESWIRI